MTHHLSPLALLIGHGWLSQSANALFSVDQKRKKIVTGKWMGENMPIPKEYPYSSILCASNTQNPSIVSASDRFISLCRPGQCLVLDFYFT